VERFELVSKGKTHGAGFLEHIKGEISGVGAGNRNLPLTDGSNPDFYALKGHQHP